MFANRTKSLFIQTLDNKFFKQIFPRKNTYWKNVFEILEYSANL